MLENSAMWNLHLIYRLSHVPARFADDVLGKVRAREVVTSVAAAPSPDASTHLAFSTPYAQVVSTTVAAKQCLREALDAHNATRGGWRQPVQLVDESAVRKVAEPGVARPH